MAELEALLSTGTGHVSAATTLEEPVFSRDDLQPKDIVFGLSGQSENVFYMSILNRWWAIYERGGHVEKRKIADAVVQEMLAQGLRFLEPCKKMKNDTSKFQLADSRKIKDKVMRQLCKLINEKTKHLSTAELVKRKATIKAMREEARKREKPGTSVSSAQGKQDEEEEDDDDDDSSKAWSILFENSSNDDDDRKPEFVTYAPAREPVPFLDYEHRFYWPDQPQRLGVETTGPSSHSELFKTAPDDAMDTTGIITAKAVGGGTSTTLQGPQDDWEKLDLSDIFDDPPEDTRADGFCMTTVSCPRSMATLNNGPNARPPVVALAQEAQRPVPLYELLWRHQNHQGLAAGFLIPDQANANAAAGLEELQIFFEDEEDDS